MADGTIKIDTSLDTSGFESGLSKLGSVAKTGVKTAMAAIGGAAAALGSLGTAAGVVGSSFEEGMSKVEAISGAAGSELEALTEKAKEMGAKTKFSARESAAAMEYMAMSGWKTQDMLSGIDGIMNLAAASGEDLALTSDIVTDALTAFGLQAKDSGRFADILAAASSNANTNVSLMGETFKYVAPVAGALGYAAEDAAVAIGLMANSGIKGSQAGTALRSILSRIAKPTKEVQTAMDDLGVSLTDSSGNMKSMDELMQDLRKGFSGLTEAQKAEYAASIAGQEGMSGLLAIVSASDEDFNKLKESVYGCDGAAEKMARTMQDNLKGSITILKSSLEGLGIEVYESASKPLKEAADAATGYVNDLTDAFKNGGLKGLISEAGDIFAELATNAAEQAPEMVNAAVSLLESFAGGLIKNKARLGNAAKEIIKALADGLVKLLPKEIQRPVKKAIDELGRSFESGGLKRGIDTVITMFRNFARSAGNLADAVLPPVIKLIDVLADNLGLIVPAAAGAYAGIKTFNGIVSSTKGIGSMISKVKDLWGLLSAHPIGLAISAGAALLSGVAALSLAMEDEIEVQYALTEEQKRGIETTNELYESYKQTVEAREEAFADTAAEFAYYEDLWNELQGIVDQNGKINEGYEGRAKFITTTLSEALGVEIEIIDGQIQTYNELNQKILDVIQTKKAEAYLAADEEAYTEAIRNQKEALTDYLNKQKEATDAWNEYQQAVDDAKNAQEEFNKYAGESPDRAKELGEALEDANRAVELTKDNYDKLNSSYKQAEERYLGYVNTIKGHEGVVESLLNGDSEGIKTALSKMINDFVFAEGATRETLQNQVKTMQDTYDSLKQAVDEGAPGVTREMVDEAKDMVFMAVSELDRFDELAAQKGEDGVNSFTGSIRAGKPSTAAAGRELLEETSSGMKSVDFTSVGTSRLDQIKSGIFARKTYVSNAAVDSLEYARSQAELVDSTSVGENFGSGAEKGINSYVSRVADAARRLMKKAMDAANEEQGAHSPAKKMIKSGHWFGEGTEIGIEEKIPDVARAGGNMMRAAINAADRQASLSSLRSAMDYNLTRIAGNIALRNLTFGGSSGSDSGKVVNQTVNINQPVKSPVETSRELRKVGKELAFG